MLTRWVDWKNEKNIPRMEPVKGAPLIRNWTGNSWQKYNGDGNFIYPGEADPLPSPRIKYMCDGIEDALYFQLLENALSHSAGMPEYWRKKAERELAVEPDLVKSLTEYTNDPGKIRNKRERIAQLLDEYESRQTGKEQ